MARRVFFSFHFDKDAWKVSQIRNAHALAGGDSQQFLDHADWEAVKRKGDAGIKKWIDDQMSGSSVLVVLFGTETYKRPWVKYEIKKAHGDGRGIIGISLHGMKGQDGIADNSQCINPFPHAGLGNDGLGRAITYPVYAWLGNDGRANAEGWIEKAAKAAGY